MGPFYFIDYLLDRVTMYRLVLYVLIGFLLAASFLSTISVIHYSVFSILASTAFLIAVCWVTNTLFALVYEVPANEESFLITALILALIISPVKNAGDFMFLGWAGILAMSSKYILAFKRKHLFNPAAIAVVITALFTGDTASWWVGTVYLAPFVILGSFLVIRKLHLEDLVFGFFFTALVMLLLRSVVMHSDLFNTLRILFLQTPFIFFAGIMLTEPFTLPPTKRLQAIYGGLIGVLFSPLTHIGSFYFTPEFALIGGNIFSYLVSPKEKLLLTLKEKMQIAPDIIDFVFLLPKRYAFTPGQYMEWTLPHENSDSRGNRRFFTIASSPTEETLRLGVKFYENGSSYKKAMSSLTTDTKMLGGSLAGSFTLPKDNSKKLVFLAGGIGVTPYRSMLKYLIDKNEKRDIIHFFSNKYPEDIVYKDVFDEAERKLEIRTIYTITDTAKPYAFWTGRVGRIDAEAVKEEVPDWKERIFYLSGPHMMVAGYESMLKSMGVSAKNIVKDFFPGLV